MFVSGYRATIDTFWLRGSGALAESFWPATEKTGLLEKNPGALAGIP